MKKLMLFSIILSVLFIFTSCKEECGVDENPICGEMAPIDEDCEVAFKRWFFDSETNSCQEIFYGGCNLKGFATKENCETCQCD